MFDSNKYRFDKGYELGKKHGKTINISLGVIIGYGIGFFLICLKYLQFEVYRMQRDWNSGWCKNRAKMLHEF